MSRGLAAILNFIAKHFYTLIFGFLFSDFFQIDRKRVNEVKVEKENIAVVEAEVAVEAQVLIEGDIVVKNDMNANVKKEKE